MTYMLLYDPKQVPVKSCLDRLALRAYMPMVGTIGLKAQSESSSSSRTSNINKCKRKSTHALAGARYTPTHGYRINFRKHRSKTVVQ